MVYLYVCVCVGAVVCVCAEIFQLSGGSNVPLKCVP